MTTPEVNAVAEHEQKQQQDKELNFSNLRKELERERNARIELEREKNARLEAEKFNQNQLIDENDDNEPYVDNKKLNRKLSYLEKQMEEKIEKKAEFIAKGIVEKQKNETWLKSNPDFFETIEKYANEFAKVNPELAETILQFPDNLERQKLVYKNIKALGLDRPPPPVQTVQNRIDSNRRSPYYQPSGVATAPYNADQSDFSAHGQKQAYAKMKELQNRLSGGR